MEVITVDLGTSVDSIIADDIERLTGKNEADIRQMTEMTRNKINQAFIKKEQIRQEQEQSTLSKHEALSQSFQLLKSSGDSMLSLAEIAKPAEPIFAPNATFVAQFNKYLREVHGGEYILSKHTKAGKTVYRLRLFNIN